MSKPSHTLNDNLNMESKHTWEKSAISKMPKATTEQLNLAKLLNKSTDDAAFQNRVRQVQECTTCSLEEAISALHDSDNNVNLAIEALLDTNVKNNDWQMSSNKKSKSRRVTEQVVKAKPTGEIPSDSHKEDSEYHKSEEEQDVTTSEIKKVQVSKRIWTKGRSGKSLSDKHEISTHSNGKTESANIKDSEADVYPAGQKQDCWSGECGEWKGEAIEIVNSTSDFPINIHEDTELFKLATTEPEEPELVEESPPDETPEPVSKELPFIPEPSIKETPQLEPVKTEKETASSLRSELFGKFARSRSPETSCLPHTAVFFAPGAKASTASDSSYSFGYDLVQSSIAHRHELNPLVNNVHQSAEKMKLDNHERKPKLTQSHYETSAEEIRLKSPSQCNFAPVTNSILPPVPKPQSVPEIQSERSYPPTLPNASVLKDAFDKLQEQDSSQTRTSYDSSNSFNNYLLDELSQNMSKANIDVRSNKTDAFTQSHSSNQPGAVSPPYHSVQSIKPPVSQLQIGKPMSNMSPITNQQSMPNTQSHPQMHPAMHIFSQLQAAFPMFNVPGNSAGGPHLLDFEQLQALQQQQRFLYDFQQQSQQPQTNATETTMVNNCSDIMSSKSTAPMSHVTSANTAVRPDFLASTMNHNPMLNSATAAPFLPYPGLVFMNGYPNPFMNQQQASQLSGSQSQSSGHGGSPLTQHQSAQPQYVKGMNSTSSYPTYQSMRQVFEDVNDLSYPNMKQVAYKHSGNQPVYGSQQGQQNPEMSSLSSKLQTTSSMAPNLGGLQQQTQTANQYQHSTGGGPTNPFNFYQQQYIDMAMAAVAAQQQHPVTNQSNIGGGVSGNGVVTNAQIPGGSIQSGMHGGPSMPMGGVQPGMHHQRQH